MDSRLERFITEGPADYRSPAQIDRDRVQYASAFSRLAEVTQVVSPERGYVFHNRLTHSLKVAQLARRLAEKLLLKQRDLAQSLGGLCPDVAEAAGLAHDLGHPPFGHLAEEELDHICVANELLDGYEGNAQTLRIVAKIAVGDANDPGGGHVVGLNLTRATLNGILKYPWLRNENPQKPKKWGAYESERDLFNWIRETVPALGGVKSIEAELMDWADDITFSVHDLVDFYCAGQIPLDRLAAPDGEEEREAFFEEVFERNVELRPQRDSLKSAFSEIVSMFPIGRRYVGSLSQRRSLWQFTTVLISRYVDAISLQLPSGSGDPMVRIESALQDEVRMLKELTWHYVILNNELATDQCGHRNMVRAVFDQLKSASEHEKELKIFPAYFKDQLKQLKDDPKTRTRVVVDYISSMTERELINNYYSLTGKK